MPALVFWWCIATKVGWPWKQRREKNKENKWRRRHICQKYFARCTTNETPPARVKRQAPECVPLIFICRAKGNLIARDLRVTSPNTFRWGNWPAMTVLNETRRVTKTEREIKSKNYCWRPRQDAPAKEEQEKPKCNQWKRNVTSISKAHVRLITTLVEFKECESGATCTVHYLPDSLLWSWVRIVLPTNLPIAAFPLQFFAK